MICLVFFVKVLITDEVAKVLVDILEKEGLEVIYRSDISSQELLDAVSDVEVLVVRSRTKVMRGVIDRAKKLRLIARVGVGLDNIDVKYAEQKNIEVINAGAATARSVAELTISLMISLIRKTHFGYEQLRKGLWVKKKIKGHELYGKTLGLIGVGNIGTLVGQMAYYGFGMRVLGFRRNLNKVRDPIKPTRLESLLSESDIISLHIPLNESTRGFLDDKKISLMKDGVYIVNTSRMEVIDIDSLIDALRSGKVAGFAADTNLKPEHPKIMKLLSMPNVLLTPHIGAQTYEAQERAAKYIAEQIILRCRR